MELLKDYKSPLYIEAVQFSQRPFSSRMGLNGGRNVFVERIDRDHEPIQRELREGLTRIEQVYKDSMSKLLKNTGIGGAAGVGLGSVWFGIGLMSAGPGAWLFGAAFGAIFVGASGLITGALITSADASIKRMQLLTALFNKEVEFVTTYSAELNQRILEQPEERPQLELLRSQFDWVLARPKELDREATIAMIGKPGDPYMEAERSKKYYESCRKKMEEENQYNQRLALSRYWVRL